MLIRASVTFEPVWPLPSGALCFLAQVAAPSVLTPRISGTGTQVLLSQQMAHSGSVARNKTQGACGGLTVQIRRRRKMISHICLWLIGQLEGRETQPTGSDLSKEGKQGLDKWEKHGATLLGLSVASPSQDYFIALWFKKTAWRFSIWSENLHSGSLHLHIPSVAIPITTGIQMHSIDL